MKNKILSVGLIAGCLISFAGCNKEYKATYAFTETPVLLENYVGTAGPSSDKIKYVKFGDYPQTIMAKDVKLSSFPSVNGWYVGSDGNYYARVEENGNSVTETYSDGTQVKAKSDVPNVLYFKVEPILWRLVSTDYGKEEGSDGNALLLAESIIESGVPFYDDARNTRTDGVGGKTVYATNYTWSQLRAYLNGLSYNSKGVSENKWEQKGFLQTAFTESAEEKILETKIDNSILHMSYNGKDKINKRFVCADTVDKIFILSELEAVAEGGLGFPACDVLGEKSSRMKFPTDYALARYAFKLPKKGFGGKWWLRSPYYDFKERVRIVTENGYARFSELADSDFTGIVPALAVNNNSIEK